MKKKMGLFMSLSIILWIFLSCQMPDSDSKDGVLLSARTVLSTEWTTGALQSAVISPENLKPLEGSISGPEIWKSNNPEAIYGDGWLSLNSRTDNQRGGSRYPLNGKFNVYLFHVNKSGSTKYLHLIVTNPNEDPVTLSGKGSMYTNTEKPLNGAGTGQSFAVSRDWLLNTPRTSFSNVSIAKYQAYQVYRIQLNNGAMVDGRYEINASEGVFVYSVITSTGSLTDAINKSQGAPASGEIRTPSATTYGREAGVYAASEFSGTTVIMLPENQSHIGFALDTEAKLPKNGVYLQDQTAPAVARMDDSSESTFGNYGHYYDIVLQIHNPFSENRQVTLSFASTITGTVNTPSFTYNGPLNLNGTIKNVYTRPTDPKYWLATWTIPANGYFNGKLKFYIPGLITIPLELILETN
ncbi:MAG: DUF3370 family protein [Spirochaetales bacterium]|nr:DUF3370 family protein [Spirochaetales bacterium]